VQVDPLKPTLKAHGAKRLKLKCDILLSNIAFNFNLRRYSAAVRGVQEWLRAWQTQIAQEAIGGVAPAAAAAKSGKKSAKPGARAKRRRALDSDGSDGSDGDWGGGGGGGGGTDSEEEEGDGYAARRYVSALSRRGVPATGMLLAGPVGAGKTAAVYAAARYGLPDLALACDVIGFHSTLETRV